MDNLTRVKDRLADRYAIDREIGAGGMATIYLARDLRHDRMVAIKLLNREIGAELGTERFLAEIKVTANLRHPNLLPLYDSGEVEGRLFYVMPYIEGESLRARLNRERQLPVEDTVRIAVGALNALEYAHQHGVVHRDLKPENILLENGEPLVADFGISLAVKQATGERMTGIGVTLGTPKYMSPEQAVADPVIDRRTDIFSFGAIVYEMLTGDSPYDARSPQAVYARILIEKPRSIRSIRPAVPEYIEAAVMRALEQLPADRFSSAREFADALLGRVSSNPFASATQTQATAAHASGAQVIAPQATESFTWRTRLRDPVMIGVAIVGIASLIAAAAMRGRTNTNESRVVRFVLHTPDSARAVDNPPWPAAISDNGGIVVYSVAKPDGNLLYYLPTDQLRGRPIPGTENATQPIFSPDGQWVAFETNEPPRLRKVRLDGSIPITVANTGGGNGADWTIDDQIVLGAGLGAHGLLRVSANGGNPVEFAKPRDTSAFYFWPVSYPDGRLVAFTIYTGSLTTAQLATVPLAGGDVIPLKIKGVRPLAVLDGALTYVQEDGAVMAVHLDRSGRRVAGDPVPVMPPVRVTPGMNGNSGVFISHGGGVISQRLERGTQLGWDAGNAPPTVLNSAVRNLATPRLSPDGQRIALETTDQDKRSISIYDIRSGTLTRLVTGGGLASPSWTPDGRRIVYVGPTPEDKPAVWAISVVPGATPEKLFDAPAVTSGAVVSPDGRSVLMVGLGNNFDIFRVRLDSARVPTPYVNAPTPETDPRFSPDGRWIAWVSSGAFDGGSSEVFASTYPKADGKVQISAGGGSEPLWSRDGKSIVYRSGSAIVAARLAFTPSFRVVSRDTIVARSPFETTSVTETIGPTDIAADGRILGLLPATSDFQLVVVPNWLPELKHRLSVNPRR
ncbi:MAG TPA: protein kinase [Gemmatimonadaceae bacterium]